MRMTLLPIHNCNQFHLSSNCEQKILWLLLLLIGIFHVSVTLRLKVNAYSL